MEREQTPVDENGEYNFEDIHAIDIKLFNDHMNALLRGEKVEYGYGRLNIAGAFDQMRIS